MSRFAGYINLNKKFIDKDILKRMSEVFSHRRFEDERILSEDRFGMISGCLCKRCRNTYWLDKGLKTIGSLDSGHQLMTDITGLVSIVYDGEVYNYLELKRILERKGYIFRSDCDTEVILNSYMEWGKECLNKFNGIFAFCIFDKRFDTAFLARDHIGVKPLYFCYHNQTFLFASEIKSLFASKKVPKRLDYEALSDFLSLNYIPGSKTLIEGIKKLQAGHYLTYSKRGVSEVEYWDMRRSTISQNRSDDYYEEKFLYLLEDSIKKRLVGEVPKGIFLSGGLDSSCLTYFISKSIPKIQTFSLGFKEKAFDDNRIYAKWIANQLGTYHRDMILEANRIDVDELKKITWFIDDLNADPTVIATFFISDFASNSVRVVFDGTGPDQMLAGFDTYIADRILSLYKMVPELMKNYLADYVSKRLVVGKKPAGVRFKLKKFLNGARFFPERAHFYWREIFSEEEKKNLCAPHILERMNSRDPFSIYKSYYQNIDSDSSMEKFLYADTKVNLVSMLQRSNSIAQAFSLTGRLPFLDYRLVDFCINLPLRLRLKGFTTKYILKKVMKDKLPAEIVYRKKRGFTTPLNIWIKNDWHEMVRDILFSSKLTGEYFNAEYIKKLLTNHYERREDNSWKIFGLICFYLWVEVHNIDIY